MSVFTEDSIIADCFTMLEPLEMFLNDIHSVHTRLIKFTKADIRAGKLSMTAFQIIKCQISKYININIYSLL